MQAGPRRAYGPADTARRCSDRELRQARGSSSTNGAVIVHAAGTEPHLNAVESGVTLRFTPSEWAAFRAGVRDGEFDLLVLTDRSQRRRPVHDHREIHRAAPPRALARIS